MAEINFVAGTIGNFTTLSVRADLQSATGIEGSYRRSSDFGFRTGSFSEIAGSPRDVYQGRDIEADSEGQNKRAICCSASTPSLCMTLQLKVPVSQWK